MVHLSDKWKHRTTIGSGNPLIFKDFCQNTVADYFLLEIGIAEMTSTRGNMFNMSYCGEDPLNRLKRFFFTQVIKLRKMHKQMMGCPCLKQT